MKPQVSYYLIKDYSVTQLFNKLLELTEEIRTDIDYFIYTYAPEAKLYKLKTEGNLQIKYMSFEWIFPSIESIPENTYTDFKYVEGGVVATPDLNTEKGLKLREEQMQFLNLCTLDSYELWFEEIAPQLAWSAIEEPGLIYNKSRRIFILIVDNKKPHGLKSKYKPPIGVVCVSKIRVDELIPNIN